MKASTVRTTVEVPEVHSTLTLTKSEYAVLLDALDDADHVRGVSGEPGRLMFIALQADQGHCATFHVATMDDAPPDLVHRHLDYHLRRAMGSARRLADRLEKVVDDALVKELRAVASQCSAALDELNGARAPEPGEIE
jgi:hypothetical protein